MKEGTPGVCSDKYGYRRSASGRVHGDGERKGHQTKDRGDVGKGTGGKLRFRTGGGSHRGGLKK